MSSYKVGFPFYSLDTDRYQDIKIKRLKKDFGATGLAIYDYILNEIYRVKGCFLVWDDSTAFDVADYFGLKESLVREVVNYCGVVGLFDKGLLTRGNVISSLSIQARYQEMCRRAKRIFPGIPEVCTILPEECTPSSEVSPPSSEESPHSIVEYSKVEKSTGAKALVGLGTNDPKKNEVKKQYDSLVKTLEGKDRVTVWNEIKKFIQDNNPVFIEPYMDAWNVFAVSVRLINEPQKITDKRKKKFHTRIGEPAFDFLKILEKIKHSNFLKGNNEKGWKVSIEFILDSEENYIKILEDKYN